MFRTVYRILTLAIFLLPFSESFCQPVFQWERTFVDQFSGNKRFHQLERDAQGNLYVGIVTGGPNGSAGVVKFDTLGNEIWRTTEPLITGISLEFTELHVNPDGSSAILLIVDDFDGFNKWELMKFSPSGNFVFQDLISNNPLKNEEGASILMDLAGNVYASGYTYLGNAKRGTVVSYGPTGVPRWTYTRPASSEIEDLALGANGTLFLAGTEVRSGTVEGLVCQLDTGGVLQWENWYHPSGNLSTFPFQIQVDAVNSAWVTGFTNENNSNHDLFLFRVNNAGSFSWTDTLDGISGSYDAGKELRIGNSGEAYIGGYAGSNNLVVRYDSSGNRAWKRILAPVNKNVRDFKDLEYDSQSQTIYASGLNRTNYYNSDATLTRLTSTGTILYDSLIHPPNSSANDLDFMCLSPSGSAVYMSGAQQFDYTSRDEYIQKRNPSGQVVWTVRNDNPSNRDCIPGLCEADQAGNLIFSVLSPNSSRRGRNGHLGKYRRSGNIEWIERGGWDSLGGVVHLGLHLDGSDNIYFGVTGRTNLSSTKVLYKGAFSPTGQELWSANAALPTGAVSTLEMTGDGNGNSVWMGKMVAGGDRVWLRKTNASGTDLWTRDYAFPGATTLDPKVVRVDSAGNIYVGGLATLNFDLELVAMKFDPSGNLVWSGHYAYPGAQVFEDMELTSLGTPVVFGTLSAALFSVAFQPANGNLAWLNLQFSSGTPPVLNDVTPDDNGNLLLAADLKLSGGGERSCLKFSNSGALIYTLDGNNNGGALRAFPISDSQSGGIWMDGNSRYYYRTLDSLGNIVHTDTVDIDSGDVGPVPLVANTEEHIYVYNELINSNSVHFARLGAGVIPALLTPDTTVCQGATFRLRAEGGTTYQWSPTSGLSNSSVAEPLATISGPITYTLVTTDSTGTDTFSVNISVSNPPQSGFQYALAGASASFSDTSSGMPTALLWDFGDGNTSTQSQPAHIYAAAGTYTVCLIASNPCGADTSCQTLTVTCPPGSGLIQSSIANPTVCDTSVLSLTATFASQVWSTGATSPDILVTQSGTYSVAATDTNSCVLFDTLNYLPDLRLPTWINLTGSSASGDTLYRTLPGNSSWGDCGAASIEALQPFTDGGLRYVPASTAWNYYVGLSAGDDDAGQQTIDYAFFFSKGKLRLRTESGLKVNLGTYTSGDVLELRRVGTTMEWRQNGAVIYSLTVPASEALIVDVSLRNKGMYLTNVEIDFCEPAPLSFSGTVANANCFPADGSINLDVGGGVPPYFFSWSSGATTKDLTGLSGGNYSVTVTDNAGTSTSGSFEVLQKVIWENFYNSVANGDTLSRTLNNTSSWGNCGARSDNKLLGNSAGSMIHIVHSNSYFYYLGWSDVDTSASQFEIDYSFYNAKGSLYLREETNFYGNFGTVNIGDTLRLERDGSTISYYKNSGLLRSLAVNPAETLQVDNSLYSRNTELYQVYVDFCDTVSGAKRSIGNPEMEANQLKAWPNPTSGEFYLEWGAEAEPALTLRDLQGRETAVPTRFLSGGAKLELSQLPAAIYLLEIRFLDRLEWVKVHKMD